MPERRADRVSAALEAEAIVEQDLPDKLARYVCRELPHGEESCRYTTRMRKEMRTHLRLHLTNFPDIAVCDVCDYISEQRGNLKSHMPKHTGIRAVQCRVSSCLNVFKSKSTESKHYKNVHLKLGREKIRKNSFKFIEENSASTPKGLKRQRNARRQAAADAQAGPSGLSTKAKGKRRAGPRSDAASPIAMPLPLGAYNQQTSGSQNPQAGLFSEPTLDAALWPNGSLGVRAPETERHTAQAQLNAAQALEAYPVGPASAADVPVWQPLPQAQPYTMLAPAFPPYYSQQTMPPHPVPPMTTGQNNYPTPPLSMPSASSNFSPIDYFGNVDTQPFAGASTAHQGHANALDMATAPQVFNDVWAEFLWTQGINLQYETSTPSSASSVHTPPLMEGLGPLLGVPQFQGPAVIETPQDLNSWVGYEKQPEFPQPPFAVDNLSAGSSHQAVGDNSFSVHSQPEETFSQTQLPQVPPAHIYHNSELDVAQFNRLYFPENSPPFEPGQIDPTQPWQPSYY
ncbi:hypothetical protein CERSUDRAFT_122959 [Gelatoporia subvermispora B]|uniref:C2H2-type domain-containing protein n=1 Tax=Ceriporiopsis subvermispora (strain B) TaxID=914234 RepID=M2R139_CERS8|nr:hypothetical protein CERSUDRAFT_122959 [Gelatoporia subvermispora B]